MAKLSEVSGKDTLLPRYVLPGLLAAALFSTTASAYECDLKPDEDQFLCPKALSISCDYSYSPESDMCSYQFKGTLSGRANLLIDASGYHEEDARIDRIEAFLDTTTILDDATNKNSERDDLCSSDPIGSQSTSGMVFNIIPVNPVCDSKSANCFGVFVVNGEFGYANHTVNGKRREKMRNGDLGYPVAVFPLADFEEAEMLKEASSGEISFLAASTAGVYAGTDTRLSMMCTISW